MPEEPKVPRPPMPPQPKTVEIEAVTVNGTELAAVLKEMREMRAESAEKFIEIVTRQDQFEDSLTGFQERLTKQSERARSESQADLDRDAKLSEEIQKREAETRKREELEKATIETRTRVDEIYAGIKELRSIAANPLARKVAYGLALLFIAWLASKGIKL